MPPEPAPPPPEPGVARARSSTATVGDSRDGPASGIERPPFATVPVTTALAVVAVLLTATSQRYGFHRDELYFRMLDPAWGYVDQPALTPLLARAMTAVADEPWAMRVPATLSLLVAVLVLVLITREVGGGRRAQTLCAWAVAGSAFPLIFGHVLLSASVDLVAWPLVCLFAMRAVLRADPRWWLAVGLVLGLATYNKLLIGMLVAGLAVGLLATGPRRVLREPLLWAGALGAAVIALPNLLYQALNDWPQLAMGAALGENNGDEVRALTVPFLLLLLGPPLVPMWLAGCAAPFRRSAGALRHLRFVVVALPVVVAATLVGGTQFYYPLGILAVVFAIGCRPVADWMTTRARHGLVVGAVALNAAVSVAISLPVVPVSALGATPIPAINQVVADSVGWPTYVAQVAAVYDAAPVAEDPVVLTANYGEAGAIARYGPAHGIDAVYSGHNELWFAARPPDSATAAVVVGEIGPAIRDAFSACELRARLDNLLGVDNEEQGVPVSVCSGRRMPWVEVWPRLAHLD